MAKGARPGPAPGTLRAGPRSGPGSTCPENEETHGDVRSTKLIQMVEYTSPNRFWLSFQVPYIAVFPCRNFMYGLVWV
jgi:hypothetical protein